MDENLVGVYEPAQEELKKYGNYYMQWTRRLLIFNTAFTFIPTSFISV